MQSSTSISADRLQQLAQQSPQDLRIEPIEQGVSINLVNPDLHFLHSFVSGPIARRANQSTQLLLKACNNKQRSIHRILDLTAGWGVDAFILAGHGHEVTLLEHNALLHAIVAHSLQQLAITPDGEAVAQLMALQQAEAKQYLQTLPEDHQFDCIYLDPMFEAHKSGAKPAKEMQILQALTENKDIESCLEQALAKARKRVVVKRGAKTASLGDKKPDLVQRAKTIRFDIYLTA
jgi:16S rRNA (guanine1516-N2)-methyltransferase